MYSHGEDERMARHLYEEMLQNAHRSGPDHSIPPLREIMDMELAQAIYKADVVSLLCHVMQILL